jgi:hypothetical protein
MPLVYVVTYVYLLYIWYPHIPEELRVSPNKTLYMRDEDTPVWERAELAAETSRQSLSQLVTAALRHYLPTICTPAMPWKTSTSWSATASPLPTK